MSQFIKQYKWHDEYPKNCPKLSVQPVRMEIFRFVEVDPPNELDFIPHAKKNTRWYNDCNGWGISFFTSEQIMRQKQINSVNLKNKLIAKGVIDLNDGKVDINNITGHINLWIYDGADIHKKFRVI